VYNRLIHFFKETCTEEEEEGRERMTLSYTLVFETIQEAPLLDIDYKSYNTETGSGQGQDMASGGNTGEGTEGLTFLSSPLPSVLCEEQRKERGQRKPTDIIVETIVEPGCETWAERAAAAQPRMSKSRNTSKETTPSDSSAGARSKESTPLEGRRPGKETSPLSMDDRINFISGNPFVEVTKGVIHLFKCPDPSEPLDTEMMCMFGVPAKHKTADLLQLTAPCHQDLEYMRVVHDGSPNQYMVLFKFRDRQSAAEFQSAYNGLPYNSLEPEVCSVLAIARVEHCKESEFYPQSQELELPYCTICLERMDESVSTVMTILCNHKFHSSCLAQWEDPTCPVCRYVQSPEVVTEHLCLDCQSSADLWICLVCGYVGCGRYAGGHAHQHFLDTQHCYSMELGHNRVWDYVGDSFVHRLVQSQEDGKLVEQERGGGVGEGKGGGVDGVAVDNEEKMDSLQLEYTYLLTRQLEDQREYFQCKLARVEETAGKEVAVLTERVQQEGEVRLGLETELEVAKRERAKSDAKIGQLCGKVTKLMTDLEEEKQLNRSLRENQAEWQTKLRRAEVEAAVTKQTKDTEIQELREQVRDLMFYMEAQAKVKDSELKEEIQNGSITVGEAPEKPVKGRKKGKK